MADRLKDKCKHCKYAEAPKYGFAYCNIAKGVKDAEKKRRCQYFTERGK